MFGELYEAIGATPYYDDNMVTGNFTDTADPTSEFRDWRAEEGIEGPDHEITDIIG